MILRTYFLIKTLRINHHIKNSLFEYLECLWHCITILVSLSYAILFAGGVSIGCPGNAGAAGTYFNADLLSLRVGNDNITTETETPLLDFSTSPLWSNVFVENNAKALVPLLWTRVQVLSDIISCLLAFFASIAVESKEKL